MIAKEVTIQGEFELSGTLTIPTATKEEKFPAILIISGSGKGDRDGNIKKMNLNMYKDLADFLTEHGFITLRYDKRGTYRSKGNYLEAGLGDLIQDASDAVRFLQNHQEVDSEKIFILGHSEGALMAPTVHQKTPVAGLILLAGAARPSKALSQFQTDQVYTEMNEARGLKGGLFRLLNIPKKAEKQNNKLLKKIMASDQPVMRVRGVRLNAKWMRETLTYDVGEYLKDVTCPVLAVTGGKDVQVPPEDAEKIAEMVQGEAEYHIIKNMNHILRNFDGNHTLLGLMKEYKSLMKQPIDPDLLDILNTWLKKYVKM